MVFSTARRPNPVSQQIAAAAEPLPPLDAPEFGMAFDRYGDARVVLLGEASHGTAEFYRARAAITRRLIERHGCTVVALEADWPDAAALDRYVRHRPARTTAGPPFERFPTWMWRNAEFAAFVDWLRGHNAHLPPERRTGIYGLDLYNLHGSIAAVLDYLGRVDPESAAIARERYSCLSPWRRDPADYGLAALGPGFARCEEGVIRQCSELFAKRLEYAREDVDAWLDAAHNARLVAAAERYYRVAYWGGPESWNLRDRHMYETLASVLAARGRDAKAVAWAHNSHIGDARQTSMGADREELNLGQLCREGFDGSARLIGFGTHTGTVAAASQWGGELEIKDVRPSLPGSCEQLCHEAGIPRFLLDFGSARTAAVREPLAEFRLERYIGVIYRPATERLSHYAESALARQYDGWVWFDETRAVTPLGRAAPAGAGAARDHPLAP